MPTQITSAGITFTDTTSLTSATLVANSVGTTQIVNGSVTAAKLGTTEQKQIAKAWVNFNGTTSPGTIRSSYNVSSVTKNGTGDYTVNFPVGALADVNYSVSGLCTGATITNYGATISWPYTSTPTTGSSRILIGISSGATFDAPYVSFQVFGN